MISSREEIRNKYGYDKIPVFYHSTIDYQQLATKLDSLLALPIFPNMKILLLLLGLSGG